MFAGGYSDGDGRSQSSRDDETEFQDDDFLDALSRAGPRSSNGTGTSGEGESDKDDDDDSFEVEFTMEEEIMRGGNALPSWVFGIEDDEDLELATSRQSSLLEELEIDVAQITFSVIWMLKSPLYFFLNGMHHTPSLANSRFAWLRSFWVRLTDYNSHPIKLGRRRVVSHLRSSSTIRLTSLSPTSEVEIMSTSDITTAPLASEFGEPSLLPFTGSRNRSRTSSENVAQDGNGNGSYGNSHEHEHGKAGAGAGGVLGDILRGVWSYSDGGADGFSPSKRKHSSPNLDSVNSSNEDDDNELVALLASDPSRAGTFNSNDTGGEGIGVGRGDEDEGAGAGAGIDGSSLSGFGMPVPGEEADDKPFDFWGPFGVVTGYCSMLWLAGQDDVSYVYLVWILSSTFHHFTVSPYLEESTILLHMSILGYSLVPLIPLVFLIVVSTLPSWAVTLTESLAVTWGSIAGIMSYKTILFPVLANDRGRDRARLLLLVPTVVIFQLYVIAFMPTRRWQINNGEALKIL